jgi:flavin reductase (DIM6/NTAB) family NADH-FMN oxidoreductase RutF
MKIGTIPKLQCYEHNGPCRTEVGMEILQLSKAFTLIEPGPVVLVTTNDGQKDNVMTITWTMVIGFSAAFAITTGPWNHSYAALLETKECVISIPTVDLIDMAVGVGTCSGEDTDKFEKFGLTPVKARYVRAPLIKECLANIECRVVDIIDRHSIVVLEGVAAYFDSAREEKRMIHAVGNGAFIVDGGKIDRKEMMRSKLPSGL